MGLNEMWVLGLLAQAGLLGHRVGGYFGFPCMSSGGSLWGQPSAHLPGVDGACCKGAGLGDIEHHEFDSDAECGEHRGCEALYPLKQLTALFLATRVRMQVFFKKANLREEFNYFQNISLPVKDAHRPE